MSAMDDLVIQGYMCLQMSLLRIFDGEAKSVGDIFVTVEEEPQKVIFLPLPCSFVSSELVAKKTL